jgi:short-subunit dehydrogenase
LTAEFDLGDAQRDIRCPVDCSTMRTNAKMKVASMNKSETSKGKALITGASTGIGAVYVDRLAKRGYDLILVARNGDQLAELAARIANDTGRTIEVVVADLALSEQVLKVERILKTDPNISMLVNNAGSSKNRPFVESTGDELEEMIALNIVALTRLSNAAAKGFVSRKTGILINIGSAVVAMPDVANEVYGGSKAFVLNFTRNIAAQLAPHGVQVQIVLPGAVMTEAWARSGTDVSLVPAGAMMSAEDLVDAALSGLDQKEVITFPSLQDVSDWIAMEDARVALIPQLFQSKPASRYF